MRGILRRFDGKQGFVVTEDGEELHVHKNEIADDPRAGETATQRRHHLTKMKRREIEFDAVQNYNEDGTPKKHRDAVNVRFDYTPPPPKPPTTRQQPICKKCGAVIPSFKAKFCMACGAKV